MAVPVGPDPVERRPLLPRQSRREPEMFRDEIKSIWRLQIGEGMKPNDNSYVMSSDRRSMAADFSTVWTDLRTNKRQENVKVI